MFIMTAPQIQGWIKQVHSTEGSFLYAQAQTKPINTALSIFPVILLFLYNTNEVHIFPRSRPSDIVVSQTAPQSICSFHFKSLQKRLLPVYALILIFTVTSPSYVYELHFSS